MQVEEFQQFVLEQGKQLYRPMPWREDTRPYYVLVSELMLQQTQVERVIPRFQQFIEAFPDTESLAQASLADVLRLWQGLGYNRRAKYLHEAAQRIVKSFEGDTPQEVDELTTLPGVGVNTAGAIRVYAFNKPAVFIETNVRTVYIHHFFKDQTAVTDRMIAQRLTKTLTSDQPRTFYQALMDYGTWLKSQGVRVNTQSKHYVKQAPLKGSVRETRGVILRHLSQGSLPDQQLRKKVAMDDRFAHAIQGLMRDNLIIKEAGQVRLTD